MNYSIIFYESQHNLTFSGPLEGQNSGLYPVSILRSQI
jgi:hypothetical protein